MPQPRPGFAARAKRLGNWGRIRHSPALAGRGCGVKYPLNRTAAHSSAWSARSTLSGEGMSEVMASSAARQSGSMRLRGRSYLAFALAPEPPIADWLAELDHWLRGSPGFFAGRPAVLDLAAVTLTSPAIAHLISELVDRGIRIMGIEGVAPE